MKDIEPMEVIMSLTDLLFVDSRDIIDQRNNNHLDEQIVLKRYYFGYSPLRRWITYEVYCSLMGITDRRSVKELFGGLKDRLYSLHRERLAVPFSELSDVQAPLPGSDDEMDLLILSAEDFEFNPPAETYKGVICAEIAAADYPELLDNKGYGISRKITSDPGVTILVDASIRLIASNKGDTDNTLVVFALPYEAGRIYKATFAIWKHFFDRLSPLRVIEDIYLAVFEYHHFGGFELQSFVDAPSLIEEFSLELAYLASRLTAEKSFTTDRSGFLKSLRGKWGLFHGDLLLVDDAFLHLADRLGYSRYAGKVLNVLYAPSTDATLSFDTFFMRCERQLLAELAEQNGVSYRQIFPY